MSLITDVLKEAQPASWESPEFGGWEKGMGRE